MITAPLVVGDKVRFDDSPKCHTVGDDIFEGVVESIGADGSVVIRILKRIKSTGKYYMGPTTTMYTSWESLTKIGQSDSVDTFDRAAHDAFMKGL